MKIDSYACDVCGVQKKEANHWWLVNIDEANTLLIMPWKADRVDDCQLHLCGEACVAKKVAEFLSK